MSKFNLNILKPNNNETNKSLTALYRPSPFVVDGLVRETSY